MPNPREFPFDIRKNTTETREVIQTGYLAPAEQKILTSKTERALKRLENEITKINKNEKQKIRSEKNTYQVTTQAEKIPAPREIDLHHEAYPIPKVYPKPEEVHQKPEAYPIEVNRDNEPHPSHKTHSIKEVYRPRTAISKETITKNEDLKLLQAKAQELVNEYEKNQAPIIKGKPIGEY